MRRSFFGLLALAQGVAVLVAASPVQAHESRHVSGYGVEVGWVSEPVLVGYPNAVFLQIHDPSEQPVRSLGERLRVEVSFGDEKGPTLAFEPMEQPGRFQAALIPTRPGSYKFRLIGSVGGRAFNATFDKVERAEEPDDINFPDKLPSAAEIADRVERLGPRIDALGPRLDEIKRVADKSNSSANLNRILSIAAVVLAAAALMAALRRPRTNRSAAD